MPAKPTKKKQEWTPKYCIDCHELIKPQEKKCSYQAASMTVYYFHKSCYDKLRGNKIGGRFQLHQIEAKIREEEVKRKYRETKKQWRTAGSLWHPPKISEKLFHEEYMSQPSQKICERCGLGMQKLTPKSDVWICPNKHTEQIIKKPKAHVQDFEPSQDTKDDHLELIIGEIRERGSLTSEQLAEYTGIKRSTITWRLWEHTLGNEKSKNNQELFYVEIGPGKVQYYGLVNERIGAAANDVDLPLTSITESSYKEPPYTIADLKRIWKKEEEE